MTETTKCTPRYNRQNTKKVIGQCNSIIDNPSIYNEERIEEAKIIKVKFEKEFKEYYGVL